jgi:hypothetical protein
VILPNEGGLNRGLPQKKFKAGNFGIVVIAHSKAIYTF